MQFVTMVTSLSYVTNIVTPFPMSNNLVIVTITDLQSIKRMAILQNNIWSLWSSRFCGHCEVVEELPCPFHCHFALRLTMGVALLCPLRSKILEREATVHLDYFALRRKCSKFTAAPYFGNPDDQTNTERHGWQPCLQFSLLTHKALATAPVLLLGNE